MSDSTKPTIASSLWWRDLASRVIRQSVQFLIPVVALAKDGQATKGLNYPDITVGLVVAILITVLRMVANIRAADSAPLAARVIDRAMAAGAGTALGLIATEQFTLVHGLSWENVLAATVGSALIAVGMNFFDPGQPAFTEIVAVDPTPTDATLVQHDDPGTRFSSTEPRDLG